MKTLRETECLISLPICFPRHQTQHSHRHLVVTLDFGRSGLSSRSRAHFRESPIDNFVVVMVAADKGDCLGVLCDGIVVS